MPTRPACSSGKANRIRARCTIGGRRFGGSAPVAFFDKGFSSWLRSPFVFLPTQQIYPDKPFSALQLQQNIIQF
jgi:hypothetical protein